MKRFSFKLQRLLDIRARREREAEIALGRALGAQTELENRLKALARESYQAEAERFSPQNNAGDIRVFDLYITRLAAAREDLLREAAQAELAAQEAR
ncbi:MAG: flagellar export protein FliJ, partial [Spirochaetaceae bacterium]|nr:flagellar export protein FliJ [Spirochaetaceae bacterium]